MTASYTKLMAVLATLADQEITRLQFAAIVRNECGEFLTALGTSPTFYASDSTTEITKRANTNNAPVLLIGVGSRNSDKYRVLKPEEVLIPLSKGRSSGNTVSDEKLLAEVKELRAKVAKLENPQA